MYKKDAIAMYRTKLADNPAWALRGLVKVYEMQTADEQEMEATTEHNGVGFTGVDGEILTSFAKQYIARGTLSPKQMALLYKKMPKYAKQLLTLSDAAKLEKAAQQWEVK
jgi:hypothetical protein